MPAHLSIIRQLLFHLFKLAGRKKITSAHREGLESRRRGVNQFCSEALAIHPFFFILAKKTMILDLHLLNWSDGDQSILKRPQLHRDTI